MLKANVIFTSIDIIVLFLCTRQSTGLTKPVAGFLFYMLDGGGGGCIGTAYYIIF
jgi:hypothetical protein